MSIVYAHIYLQTVTHMSDIRVEQTFCRCRLIQTNVKFCVINCDTLARYNPGKTRELEWLSFAGKSLVLPVQVDCGFLLMEMVEKFQVSLLVVQENIRR